MPDTPEPQESAPIAEDNSAGDATSISAADPAPIVDEPRPTLPPAPTAAEKTPTRAPSQASNPGKTAAKPTAPKPSAPKAVPQAPDESKQVDIIDWLWSNGIGRRDALEMLPASQIEQAQRWVTEVRKKEKLTSVKQMVCKPVLVSASAIVPATESRAPKADDPVPPELLSRPSTEDRLACVAALCVGSDPVSEAVAKLWCPADTLAMLRWAEGLVLRPGNGTKEGATAVNERVAMHVSDALSALVARHAALLPSGRSDKTSVDDADDASTVAAAVIGFGVSIEFSGVPAHAVVATQSAVAAVLLGDRSAPDLVADLLGTPTVAPTPAKRPSDGSAARNVAPWVKASAVLSILRIRVCGTLLSHFYGSGRGDEMPEPVVDYISQLTSASDPSTADAATGLDSTCRRGCTPARTPAASTRATSASPSAAGQTPPQPSRSDTAASVFTLLRRSSTECPAAVWISLTEAHPAFAAAVQDACRLIGSCPKPLTDLLPLRAVADIAGFLSGLWCHATYRGSACSSDFDRKCAEGLRAFDPDFGPRAIIRSLLTVGVSTAPSDACDCAIIIATSVPFTAASALLADVGEHMPDNIAFQEQDASFRTSRLGGAPATPVRQTFSAQGESGLLTPARNTSTLRATVGFSSTKRSVARATSDPTVLLRWVCRAVTQRDDAAAAATSAFLNGASRGGLTAFAVAAVYSALTCDPLQPLWTDDRATALLALTLQSTSAADERSACVVQRGAHALSQLALDGGFRRSLAKPAGVAVSMLAAAAPALDMWAASVDPTAILAAVIRSESLTREELRDILGQREHIGCDMRSVGMWLSQLLQCWPADFVHELLPIAANVIQSALAGSIVRAEEDVFVACLQVANRVSDQCLADSREAARAFADVCWAVLSASSNAPRNFVVHASDLICRYHRSPILRETLRTVVNQRCLGGGSQTRHSAGALCHALLSSAAAGDAYCVAAAVCAGVDCGFRLPHPHAQSIARVITKDNAAPSPRIALCDTASLLLVLDTVPTVSQTELHRSMMRRVPGDLKSIAELLTALVACRASLSSMFSSLQIDRAVEVAAVAELTTRVCAALKNFAAAALPSLAAAAAGSGDACNRMRCLVPIAAAAGDAAIAVGTLARELNAVCSVMSAVVSLVSERPQKSVSASDKKLLWAAATLHLEGGVATCQAARLGFGSADRDLWLNLIASSMDLGDSLRQASADGGFVEAGDAPLALVADRSGQLLQRLAVVGANLVLHDVNAAVQCLGLGEDFFHFALNLVRGLQASNASVTAADDTTVASLRQRLLTALLLESNLWETSADFANFALSLTNCALRPGTPPSEEFGDRDPVDLTASRSDMTRLATAAAAAVDPFNWTDVALRCLQALRAIEDVTAANTKISTLDASLIVRLTELCCLLLSSRVVDPTETRWRDEALRGYALHLHDVGAAPTCTVAANGSLRRSEWHYFYVAKLRVLRASLLAAHASLGAGDETLAATRSVFYDAALAVLAVPRIRFVVESPVAGPSGPGAAAGVSSSTSGPLVVTPWSIDEGCLVASIVASLTCATTVSPLAGNVRKEVFLSCKAGLRDAQDRRLDAVRQALADFSPNRDAVNTRTGSDGAPVPALDGTAVDSRAHLMLISIRLSLIKALASCLPLGPVITLYAPTAPNAAAAKVAPKSAPSLADGLVPARAPARSEVLAPHLLEFVRGCLRVFTANSRQSQAMDRSSTPLSRPSEPHASGSPLARLTSQAPAPAAAPSLGGGTAGESSLGAEFVDMAAHGIDLATLIFACDARRWVSCATPYRLKEFTDVAEQLTALFQRARADSGPYAAALEAAMRLVSLLRDEINVGRSGAN